MIIKQTSSSYAYIFTYRLFNFIFIILLFVDLALHWMKKDPVGVIKGIHQALKPGGRMVVEFGGYMNVGEIHTALISGLNKRGLDGQSYSPWFFPSDTYYQQLLQENGFDVKHVALVPRPTQLDTDVAGWIKTFGFSFFNALPPEEDRDQFIQEIVEHLRPAYQREDGTWHVMYVRLRVVATKK